MMLSRTGFFVVIFLLVTGPFPICRIGWLAQSEKTTGVIAFEGMGSAGDQIKLSYTVIWFRHGNDTVWFNGMGHLDLPKGAAVPVRFQKRNPCDARVDGFIPVWGDILVYNGIPLAMLIVIALDPVIVPRGKKVLLGLRKPFLKLV